MTGENPNLQLIHGDARKIPLPDESVQCIVTSPPYWGLRKYAGEQEIIWNWASKAVGREDEYCVSEGSDVHNWETSLRAGISGGQNQGDKNENADGATNQPVPPSQWHTCTRCGAWRGAYGLEPTIEMYVAHTLEILRECRRVLRKDGVLFWNIGDSYSSGGRIGHGTQIGYKQESNRGTLIDGNIRPACEEVKQKDLCLIPERVAIAAQADGWWVRSRILWCKPNPMPESVTDRPTDAAEHIWMFTKSERYYWDADAVRDPAVAGWRGSSFTDERDASVYANLGQGPRNAFGYTSKGTHSRGTGDGGPKARARAVDGVHEDWAESTRDVLGSRNMRNVWMFATQPYAAAHFATFPEELPRRCILAATSAKGACAQCGAPWERVLRRKFYGDWQADKSISNADPTKPSRQNGQYDPETYEPPQTIGWTPTCLCPGQHGKTVPCVVLDPFGGSGTTGRVALELRRRAILVDIAYNAEYRELAERRTSGVNVKLPFL